MSEINASSKLKGQFTQNENSVINTQPQVVLTV